MSGLLRLGDGVQRVIDCGGAEVSRLEHILLCAAAGVGDIFVSHTAVLHEAGLPAMERPEIRLCGIGSGFVAAAGGLFHRQLEPSLAESRAVLVAAFGIGKAGVSVVPGVFPFPPSGSGER